MKKLPDAPIPETASVLFTADGTGFNNVAQMIIELPMSGDSACSLNLNRAIALLTAFSSSLGKRFTGTPNQHGPPIGAAVCEIRNLPLPNRIARSNTHGLFI